MSTPTEARVVTPPTASPVSFYREYDDNYDRLYGNNSNAARAGGRSVNSLFEEARNVPLPASVRSVNSLFEEARNVPLPASVRSVNSLFEEARNVPLPASVRSVNSLFEEARNVPLPASVSSISTSSIPSLVSNGFLTPQAARSTPNLLARSAPVQARQAGSPLKLQPRAAASLGAIPQNRRPFTPQNTPQTGNNSLMDTLVGGLGAAVVAGNALARAPPMQGPSNAPVQAPAFEQQAQPSSPLWDRMGKDFRRLNRERRAQRNKLARQTNVIENESPWGSLTKIPQVQLIYPPRPSPPPMQGPQQPAPEPLWAPLAQGLSASRRGASEAYNNLVQQFAARDKRNPGNETVETRRGPLRNAETYERLPPAQGGILDSFFKTIGF